MTVVQELRHRPIKSNITYIVHQFHTLQISCIAGFTVSTYAIIILIRIIVWLLRQIFDAIIVFASFAVDLVFLAAVKTDSSLQSVFIPAYFMDDVGPMLLCVLSFVILDYVFSFSFIDLVFLGGMAEDEGQKAAGIVVVLLLWRIARVVDGFELYCYSSSSSTSL